MSIDIQRMFDKAPEKFDGEKWGDDDAVISFDLTGKEGAQYSAIIKEKKLTVEKDLAENADLKVSIDADDLADLLQGNLKPMQMLTGGKIRLEGDKMLALKVLQVFGI